MLLRQIHYFHAVVETGSFTEAAEHCFISQSAISQQIQALEKEIGVKLFERKNRKFSLLPAGEFFYKKTVVLSSELKQICAETARIAHKDDARLNVGYLKSYGGDEFFLALSEFTAKYPAVKVEVIDGNHEELYNALRLGNVDLVFNDQRRAFSDEYVNCELAKAECYAEISARNPMARLDRLDIEDLKNTPCIIIASKGQEDAERAYFRDVIGFHGEFVFTDNLQRARISVASNQGILPIEGGSKSEPSGFGINRLPLYKNSKPVTRNYCAFWKEDNSGFYVEEFAQILKEKFS